jgi:hypothetical protein
MRLFIITALGLLLQGLAIAQSAAPARVEIGQKEQTQAAFTEFGKACPPSPLKADADQALVRLLTGQ